ncbi:hypothetical protein CKK33_01505 [Mucilaginibacter sp. MD40]|uniref:hypothetical protein n=1 Tax=Mucilaginibacter sp. MD40 TaxID=2029590 RepID=UPI000BAC97DC|nr:hypothetical protein [Mucilaginibacter sp. MD40]PAW92240.1 hypothetical protein CKK33_01505 [Mucilaginibacter sp. MD40]
MKVEHPQAYQFIMQEELYLLPEDQLSAASSPIVPTDDQVNEVITVVSEPIQPEARPLDETKSSAPVVIAQPVQETTKPPFNYWGENKKQFLILVNYGGVEHIPDEHRVALESILSRKGLSKEDVALLNVNTTGPVQLSALTAYFNPTRLVIMGNNALPTGIGNLPINKAVQGKKIHVLYSFSFADMMSSNENKKAFWEQMKTL